MIKIIDTYFKLVTTDLYIIMIQFLVSPIINYVIIVECAQLIIM